MEKKILEKMKLPSGPNSSWTLYDEANVRVQNNLVDQLNPILEEIYGALEKLQWNGGEY
jgi:hypothetical protein